MKDRLLRIAYPLLFLSFAVVAVMGIAHDTRPLDSDALFLIENGRYIWEHGIPHTNPWAAVEGLGIVIQQPACSLLNYLWSEAFGIHNMWTLAMLENAVLLACLFVFGRLFCKNTGHLLEAVAIFELFIGTLGIVTTRPYQITISVSLLFLTALVSYQRSEKMAWNRVGFVLATFVLSLFQANYQMAFVPMLGLWMLCFFAPDLTGALQQVKERKLKDAAREVFYAVEQKVQEMGGAFAAYFIAIPFNPYGIRGAFYLAESREAMSMVGKRISEVRPPEMSSVIHMGIVLALLFGTAVLRKRLPLWQIYMGLGCAVLTCMAGRNAWMGALALFALALTVLGNRTEKNKEVTKPALSTAMLAAAVVLFIGGIAIGVQKPVDLSSVVDYEVIEYLDGNADGDDRFFTDFNNGAVLEYAGYKVYMDARPELFTPSITGGANVLKDWVEVQYGEKDAGEFITEHDFDYYYVTKDSKTELTLRYGGFGYELVCSGELGELYRKCKE